MILYSGKVGVDKAGPTVIKWPVTSEAFANGTLVHTPTNLAPIAVTENVDIFGIVSKTVAADTLAEVSLTPMGTILSCDIGLDEMIHDGGDVAAFTCSTCVGGTDDMFIGAALLQTTVSAHGTVGAIYPITDYASATGTFTVTGGPTHFGNGDGCKLIQIEGTGTKLVGKTLFGFATDSTYGSYIAVNNTWATAGAETYGVIIGVATPNKVIVALTDTVF